MMETVRFKAEHFARIKEQKAQSFARAHMTEEALVAMEQNPWVYSGLCMETGKVVHITGLTPYWKNRAELWSILSEDCRYQLPAITRFGLQIINACPFDRIEATVDYEFEQAHRWMRLLGFQMEAPRLERYFPDGRDGTLYARVKHG